MNIKTKEILQECLDLIEDFFELADSANLTEEELELVNQEDGLFDRKFDLVDRINKIIDTSKEPKEKNK